MYIHSTNAECPCVSGSGSASVGSEGSSLQRRVIREEYWAWLLHVTAMPIHLRLWKASGMNDGLGQDMCLLKRGQTGVYQEARRKFVRCCVQCHLFRG